MNWKTLYTRTGTAIVFAAVMLLGLLYPDPMALFALAILIQFLCLREFFNISSTIFPGGYRWPAFALSVAASVWLILVFLDPKIYMVAPLLILPTLLIVFTVLSKKNTAETALPAVISILYIGVPISMWVALRQITFLLPLIVVVLIWINDTMAYLVGSFIGKTSLSPISPKKTWEGTIGGIILTMLAGAAYGYWGKSPLALEHMIAIAVIVAVFGNLGDLAESKLKRTAGIKDSGNIMPGHGGALDRFDSLLLVVPAVFVYLLFAL